MSVLVQTQGGTVKSIEATTAAQAADVLGINLDNTVISVNGTKVTSPAFLVKKSEESSVAFVNSSSFIDEMHPERLSAKDEMAKKEAAPKEGASVDVKKKAPKKEDKKES